MLGLVHATWVPVPSEFDDYIAKPKDNGYQSLHTAVIGPRGRPLEVQIRTQQMHQFAEFGVAAHWAYKEAKSGKALAPRTSSCCSGSSWTGSATSADPHQFVESLKTDIFEDQVYVFTPGGDVVDLPRGLDTARLRLSHSHHGRPPLPRRAGQRPDRHARLRAQDRRPRRDPHPQAARSRAATG